MPKISISQVKFLKDLFLNYMDKLLRTVWNLGNILDTHGPNAFTTYAERKV